MFAQNLLKRGYNYCILYMKNFNTVQMFSKDNQALERLESSFYNNVKAFLQTL